MRRNNLAKEHSADDEKTTFMARSLVAHLLREEKGAESGTVLRFTPRVRAQERVVETTPGAPRTPPLDRASTDPPPPPSLRRALSAAVGRPLALTPRLRAILGVGTLSIIFACGIFIERLFDGHSAEALASEPVAAAAEVQRAAAEPRVQATSVAPPTTMEIDEPAPAASEMATIEITGTEAPAPKTAPPGRVKPRSVTVRAARGPKSVAVASPPPKAGPVKRAGEPTNDDDLEAATTADVLARAQLEAAIH